MVRWRLPVGNARRAVLPAMSLPQPSPAVVRAAAGTTAAAPQLVAGAGATSVEVVRSCPLCGSERSATWRVARDRLHGLSDRSFRYARCRQCDLRYLAERPTAAAAGAFYPPEYGPHQGRAATTPVPASAWGRLIAGLRGGIAAAHQRLERLANARFWRRYWHDYTPPAPGAVLLDFGCGSDKFLNRARKLGWQTVGMDFSARAIEQVRAAGHRGFVVGEAAWAELGAGSVDFVRLNHVLEHLYEPRETLRRLRALLRSGGRLHVAVPNPASLSSRLFGARWFSLDCPRHTMLFPPRRLVELLGECGFRNVRVAHEAVAKDAVRSLGYLLADLRLMRGQRVAAMIDAHGLQLAAFPAMWLATAAGLGDRLHVFAQAT